MELKREQQIHKLSRKEKLWDIMVVGGGASGLGIALDAVSRGLSVLLVEKKDFGSGTSSKSTKLIHGGVRYLQQGNIKLVTEALKERSYILAKAGHITNTQEFIIPFNSIFRGLYYFIGLILYEILAGRRNIGKAKWLRKDTVIKKLPNIKKTFLKGGILYHDGQFDDARMCIDLVKTIVQEGGVCVNYCELTSFLKPGGKVSGAVLFDTLNDTHYHIKAKVIVNATGVFSNDILQMDDTQNRKMVVPSRGSHIVVDNSFIGGDTAIMIPKTTDGRILFLIPWMGSLLVGTTDIKAENAEYDPLVTSEEIKFMLDNANQYLELAPTVGDIKSVFSGLRPLAAPSGIHSKTKEISRGHQIFWTTSGICNIIGGKWTTFRKMGEDVVSDIVTRLKWDAPKSTSNNISIVNDEKASTINGNIPGVEAIEHIINCEMVETLEDLVARRTRMLFLDLSITTSLLIEWSEILRRVKKEDDEWKSLEIAKVEKLIKRLNQPLTQHF